MTIASTTSKVSYNGSGSVGPFPITFKFTKNADIIATKRSSLGVETVLTLTTHYTLTGAGAASGGALTLVTALAVGESLVIARVPRIVQEVDYVENSAFPAETHESALDLLTTICQSLQEQVDRSVKVEISSTTNPDALLAEIAVDVASAAASAATATTQAAAAAGAVSAVAALAFFKADPASVAFTKTAAGTASIKAGTKVGVGSAIVTFAAATAITMPTLAAGTNYAVWVKDDGTIQATADFTSAPGAGNWRKIGGFHYSPGGHSGAPGGGNTTPQINEYSFWDLKFRPACSDPRGMALVAGGFWADIYGLGVDHLTNGTSAYNVTLADGGTPPKIPTVFGGTGSSAYSSLTWFEANEVLRSHGKRLPSYAEFAAMAYGTTENSAIGTDPTTSSWSAAYASRWGLAQVSGCIWWWGADLAVNAAITTGWAWYNQAGGRGQIQERGLDYLTAVTLGGHWGDAPYSGSRCSLWNYSPSGAGAAISARGVCDHLTLA